MVTTSGCPVCELLLTYLNRACTLINRYGSKENLSQYGASQRRGLMDPQEAFCLNLECPARGQKGKGNIRVHSQQEQRYRCTVCGRTFSARKGKVFYRCRVATNTIILVL